MKALDTNILVRFVTKDDKAQADKVLSLFKEAEHRGEEFWIPLVVVLEMIWVLEAVYRIPREKILEVLRDLLDLPILKFESRSVIISFLNVALKSRIDLSDILIACSAKWAGCQKVITFDRRAARLELFELLG